MRQIASCCLLMVLTLCITACPVSEKDARDVYMGLQGTIQDAQQKHLDSCNADNTQDICKLINQAVDGQNALGTTIQSYCGWPAETRPDDPNAVCVPVKSLDGALKVALQNASVFTRQLKGAL